MNRTSTICRTAPRRHRLAHLILLALSLGAATTPAGSAPAKGAPAADAPRAEGRSEIAPQMTLVEGKSTLMRLPYQAARMSVGDARVADVILLNKSEVYMVGKQVGVTNLILWNKNNDATIVDLAVVMDTDQLRERLNSLLTGEKEIQISTAADTLVLSGTVADAPTAEMAVSIATAFVQRAVRSGQQPPQQQAAPGAVAGVNSAAPSQGGMAPAAGGAQSNQNLPRVINMLAIAAPQQVMLEVKVAEVSKTLVDQLGASLGATRSNGSWTYGILTDLLAGVPAKVLAGKNANNFLQIDAQKRDGLVKVLAEPTIMAISGQEASFLAGGKIFIPVSVTTSSGNREIELEEKEFGIAVRFTPTVLEGGRINLRVAPEVSDLNKEGIGISAGGANNVAILPSFTTRRATTTVQLYDGQSFAIGGLIKNNVTTNVKAFPLLGEIPVLGALFRSSDFQTDRTELVFVITPRLVKPLAPGYKLPTDGYIQPSRGEFFLEGKMEGAQKDAPAAPSQAASAATGFDLK